MMPKSFALLAATVVAPFVLSACAAGLCERKDTFMRSTCSGTSMTYHGDPMCERKIAKCNEGQLAQFRGYVECLEAQNVCSMEALASCAEKWPGGVNLACGM
ncbi:MAG: hypothetical protein KC933_16580 [Myxococcales bacterium]|nr:hypothetical protein [Myxococcales bacterium]MCB9646617.1 hypothetical protein [Deltaproteobacteria bacterium]